MSVNLERLSGKLPEGDALRIETDNLMDSLREQNEGLQTAREAREVTLNNQRAISVYLQNDSPGGGKEIDWLVTVMRPEGLVYFIAVAPGGEFEHFQPTFQQILDSARFSQ